MKEKEQFSPGNYPKKTDFFPSSLPALPSFLPPAPSLPSLADKRKGEDIRSRAGIQVFLWIERGASLTLRSAGSSKG